MGDRTAKAASSDACCKSTKSEAIPTTDHYAPEVKIGIERVRKKRRTSIALLANNFPYFTSQTTNPNPPSARTLINNHGTPTPKPSTHSFPAYNPTTYNE